MKLNLRGLSAEIKASADEILKTLGICEGADGATVEAKRGDNLKVAFDGEKYEVIYDTIAAFNRALTIIKVNADKGEFTVEECKTPDELGVMLDCSRNAVRTVEFVKNFMRTLAAMGYNQLMLYTEDTYEIEGEPRFGYMRGRYTVDELRELDAFGARSCRVFRRSRTSIRFSDGKSTPKSTTYPTFFLSTTKKLTCLSKR